MLSYLSKSLAPTPHNHHSRKSSADVEDYNDVDAVQHKCNEIKRQILSLWKTTWDGLYQTHSGKGAYRVDELHTLYIGAGMSSYFYRNDNKDGRRFVRNSNDEEEVDDKPPPCPLAGISGVLGTSSSGSRHGVRGALDGIKWYEETRLESLEVMKEIPKLEKVYEFLRKNQLPLVDPTKEHEDMIVEELKQMELDGMGRRLRHYGARLGVLGMDMAEEVRGVVERMNEEVEDGRRDGKKRDVEAVLRTYTNLKELVYPRARMKGSYMISGSGSGVGF